jgi:peptide/nickel transport system substrate-binding protein
LIAALTIAGCAPQAPTQVGPQGAAASSASQAAAASQTGPRRVTIVVDREIEAWNPYAQSASTGYSIWMNILDTLVRVAFHPDGTMYYAPVLAERWETPDAKTWTFHLRHGVKFSDGTEVTSADVLHSWNRTMNDEDSKQSGELKAYLESIDTPDPYTFRAVLKAPNVAFLDEVAYRLTTSKAQYDKLGKEQADRQPLGSGPYLFKEWVQGQRFVLARNPSYWGQSPQADEVIYRFIREDEAKLTALSNGEADIVMGLAPHLGARIGGRAHAAAAEGARHMFLVMRPDTPPTDNKLVRQAIYHAIDRAALVQGVLDGYATELKGPFQSFVIGYDPNLPTYDYNPARAKELLAQAGYAGGLSLDFNVPAGQYTKAKEVGQAIAGMLKEVGITANVKTPEWGTFSADYVAGRYGFYLIGRGSVFEPTPFLAQYFLGGNTKRVGYENPAVTDLFVRQQGTTDEAERKRLLAQLQRQIMEDVPVVFLYTYKDLYGVANHLDWQPPPNEALFGFDVRFKS